MVSADESEDSPIGEDEDLFIRVTADSQNTWIKKLPNGEYRPSSAAFLRHKDNPISVDRALKTTAQETHSRGNPGKFHVARFKAKAAIDVGCKVVPDGREGNPAHVHIHGNRKDKNGELKGALTDPEAKKIALQARIVLWEGTPPS
jgi:hypothetical protein